jgi:inosine-uridine nucleoside N-ribohydrolase
VIAQIRSPRHRDRHFAEPKTMPTRKLIIDTDPGVDDILAITLAFLTPPNDVEITLITPVFGNTSLYHTVRNTVTLLSIIDQEREWRAKRGFRPPRLDTPVVAMGADGPIDGSRIIDAKEFHGKDGIGEVHTTVRSPLSDVG